MQTKNNIFDKQILEGFINNNLNEEMLIWYNA